ncbi:MAG: hypothetical protein Kow006_10460 [Gammaproteobacteria bacterium]
MTRYQWSEAFSVGDEAVDRDHKGLFSLVEELRESDPTLINPADIIGRLSDYAQHHFAREEALMRKAGYPGYEEHIKAHRSFVDWLERVELAYRQASTSSFLIGDLVNEFLAKWLTEHILSEDMRYRDYIAGKKATN